MRKVIYIFNLLLGILGILITFISKKVVSGFLENGTHIIKNYSHLFNLDNILKKELNLINFMIKMADYSNIIIILCITWILIFTTFVLFEVNKEKGGLIK